MKAFTFLEFVVVVAIAGIIASLVCLHIRDSKEATVPRLDPTWQAAKNFCKLRGYDDAMMLNGQDVTCAYKFTD